jgi:CBS domain-containing protein
MNVSEICKRDVVVAFRSDELATAALRMRDKHIGYLVVVEGDDGQEPIGVLTDRDIVVTLVARDVDLRSVKVEDVMTRGPVTVKETDSVGTALQAMRRIGVRRVPVVGGRGQLVGVLSLDDVIDGLAEELGSVAASIRNERRIESAVRP